MALISCRVKKKKLAFKPSVEFSEDERDKITVAKQIPFFFHT